MARLVVLGWLSITAVIIGAPVSDSAQSSLDSLDIDALLEEVVADSQNDALAGYSYKLEFVRRKSTFMGTSRLVRRYEVILPSRNPKNTFYSHPLLLTFDSSRDLTSEDVAMSRREIIDRLERIEKEATEPGADRKEIENPGGYVTLGADSRTVGKRSLRINIVDLIRNSEFSNPREVSVEGRKTVEIEFRPKPDADFEEGLFYLKHVEGLILIDLDDKRIIQIEAFPVGKLQSTKSLPEAERDHLRIFLYHQTRVKEGFWFPEYVRLNLIGASKEFKDVDAAIEFLFTDYKRFSVEVESADVEKVPEPVEAPSTDKGN